MNGKTVVCVLLAAAGLAACNPSDSGQQQAEQDGQKASGQPAAARDLAFQASGEAGTIEVMLCDGETTTEVAAGEARTRADGQKIADALMAQWRRKNPQADWVEDELAMHKVARPADNSDLVGTGQGATTGRITPQDVLMWERETYKLAVEGSTIFHSPDALGSSIAVSCDMCHPDAANTHPETYPKFQEQLGRVALLRDMINWCIEHPVRGEPLEPDSAKMRALEAYILAQRKGEELNYGKR